ncbi:MAG: SusC/RagA family TonB-linked outer membrane protein [Rikenellaceae bacterium]
MNIKYNRIRSFLLCASLVVGSGSLLAQNIVKGVVYDDVHRAVEGAIVKVNGLDVAVVTNADGTFEIPDMSSKSNELVIEYVGYKTTSQMADGKLVKVYLTPDVAKANTVVSMIREERESQTIGASQYTVSGDELRRTSLNNVAAALAGRVPGLYVRTNTSEPGAETYSLYMRGSTTYNGNSPLILVDGQYGDIYNVNINDVESVTVMKDAAGAAKYGMEAAAGIISIKTKRGSINTKPTISVNASYGVQQAAKTPTMLNSGQYATLVNEAWANDGYGSNYIYSDSQIASYFSGTDRDLYPNNDWYDMYMSDYVHTTDIHASAIGGGEYVQYYTSIGYLNQDSPFNADSPIKEYGLDRFDVKSNLDVKINNFISGFVNVSARLENNIITNDDDGTDGIMDSVFDLPPTEYGPLTPDGDVIVTTTKTNSTYGRLNRSGYAKENNLNLSSNIGLKFDLDFITKGLSATGQYKYYTNNQSYTRGTTDYIRFTRDLTQPDELVFYQYGTTEDEPLSFEKESISNMRSDMDLQIDYNRTFGDHTISAQAFAYKQYLNADYLQGTQPQRRVATGGQLSYGYKNFLYADIAASYVGSDQFPEGNRYGFFPSVAVATVLSNLDFLKGNDVITYLKTRASYGIIGNDNFGDDRFIYTDYLEYSSTKPLTYTGGSISIVRLGNPLLTWEKSHKLNVGFDMTLFDAINFGMDYYNDRRTDILVDDNYTPLMSGSSSDILPQTNAGEIKNNGVEFQLGYTKNLSPDLTLSVNSNFSYYKNMVINAEEMPYTSDYAYTYRDTGFSLNQLWGYEIDYSNGNGYFNTQSELDASPLSYSGTAPRLGDFIYVDQNGDGIIDAKDVVPMGNTSTPQISWGVEAFLQYKSFDLSLQFQGLGKVGSFMSGIGYYESYNYGTYFTQHLTAWTQERYNNGEEITAPALTMNGSSSQKANNYYYQDRSFVRLKNVEIGYNLPKSVLNKISMDKLRIYGSITNALTFDKMSVDDRDVEGGAVNLFPTPRYFNVGLNLTF